MNEDMQSDTRLQDFKHAAERGSERGPSYDQGILDVFSAVEKDGYFRPSRWNSAIKVAVMQQNTATQMLTEEEDAAVLVFLHVNGWTLAEADQYCSGVVAAEELLSARKRTDDMVPTSDSILRCCTPCPIAGCGSRCIKPNPDTGTHECEKSHIWDGPIWH